MFKRSSSRGGKARLSRAGPKERACKEQAGQEQVDPGNFGKETSPVRERMTKDMQETPPEERIKPGR